MKKLFLILTVISIFLSSCWFLDGRKNPDRIASNTELQEYLLFGWNTWNNPNLLNHILMPEGLSLRVSFRETLRSGDGPYFLDHAYISGPNHIFPGKIKPFGHAYDGSYSELELEWKGLKARVQTATHGENIYILYTPLELPESPPVIILEAGMLWNKEGHIEKMDEFIQVDLGTKSFGIGSTQPDSLLPLPVPADYMTFRSDTIIGFYTGKKRSLAYIQTFVNNRKGQFAATRERFGEFADAYDAMQSLLSWNIIYDAFNDRAITPVSRIWNEAWGGYVLFGWDTYFTALMYALDNKFHAYSNAIAITSEMTPSGFIPGFSGALSNQKSFDKTQPPVGSTIVKMIYDKYPEPWFLEEVYDKLLLVNRWWSQEKDIEGYLSQGAGTGELHHHQQSGEKDPSAGEEDTYTTGSYNSSLFYVDVYDSDKKLPEMASAGLMGLYVADCKALAEIAEILGKTEDVSELEMRAEKYSASLRNLWDEESGIYRDMDLNTGKFSDHITPASFYPLIAEVPSQEQAERMIESYFMNPDEFYGEYMMPSISRSDPAFEDSSCSYGRIWAPANFLVYLGLRNYDLPEARSILAEKSLNLLMKEWSASRSIYENYNAVTGDGADALNSNTFCSGGGLLALIALMEKGYWEKDMHIDRYY